MIVIVGSNERLWCVCVCVMFKRLLDTQEKWGGEGHADSEKEHSREGKSGQRCKKYESLVEEGETTERQGKASSRSRHNRLGVDAKGYEKDLRIGMIANTEKSLCQALCKELHISLLSLILKGKCSPGFPDEKSPGSREV